MQANPAITEDQTPLSLGSRFRAAMILAVAADALQIFLFPLFAEALCRLLVTCLILRVQPCWFAFSAGIGNFSQHSLPNSCPESIWFPFWTMAVINVYRKWKRITIIAEETRQQPPALKGQQDPS